MLFILVTAIITLVCLLALIRTAKERNFLAAGFSFLSIAVFGWFTVMSTLEWMGIITA